MNFNTFLLNRDKSNSSAETLRELTDAIQNWFEIFNFIGKYSDIFIEPNLGGFKWYEWPKITEMENDSFVSFVRNVWKFMRNVQMWQ